jgi:hypothetical protein
MAGSNSQYGLILSADFADYVEKAIKNLLLYRTSSLQFAPEFSRICTVEKSAKSAPSADKGFS